jgi:hypothetical protein
MKTARVVVMSAVLLTLTLTADARASTLTFDDISGAEIGTIPNGYGGLQWNLMGYTDGGARFSSSGYENGTVSGDYVAFNEFASVGTVSGGLFDFTSAYLTAAWNDGLTIVVTGLLSGSSIYTQTVSVDTSGPTLFNFNFLGIDQLTFASSGGVDAGLDGSGTHFAMDDMTVNVSSVPDGGSALAMLGFAMIGVNVIRRKFSI